jgi:hypothetical protein
MDTSGKFQLKSSSLAAVDGGVTVVGEKSVSSFEAVVTEGQGEESFVPKLSVGPVKLNW